MGFIELDIKDLYITDSDNIPEEFYGISLPETILYKRAAGFFSSSAFSVMGKGLRDFYYNGGKMQLLVSPIFSEEDYEAIEKGYKAQEDLATQRIIEQFDIDNIKENEGTNILAWLIYEKRLDIRVVIKKEKRSRAIFHDKFSILIDEDGNRITYRGSMNESYSGLVDNFETIEVDCSWEPIGYRRAKQREDLFDSVWSSNSNNWSTIKLPSAIEESLIKIRKPIEEYNYIDGRDSTEIRETYNGYKPESSLPKIPEWLSLREYQKDAIKAWIKNNNRGIFEMATGTGKTKTSLAAISKILDVYYSNNVKCGLVIIVPYIVLLEQWLEDLHEFNIYPIACYESKEKWYKRVKDSIELFNNNASDKFAFITTNKTFATNDFQSVLNSIDGDYIFCADEMHHLISDNRQECLPDNAKYRLGLSATLMSKYNDSRMDTLKNYFGGIVYTYSMEDAIRTDCLTKYFYHPVYIELTEDEKYDYYDISKKISKIIASNDGEIDDENKSLKALLSQRARLLASAENKLIELGEVLKKIDDPSKMIVYCGDKIEADVKYIDRVYEIINNEMGIISAKFTAGENKKQREHILETFKSGLINSLVAVRCLDEGVDIPELQTAIIMSSGTNPKEFIQRRGRILRKAAGKEYAHIYDFIVIPTLDKRDIDELSLEEKDIEMKIIAREFERVKEFAGLAENGTSVVAEFLGKWSLYVGGSNNA